MVILFTKFPAPGKVKSRLIPALGAAGAAALHREMTELTLVMLRQFAGDHRLSLQVSYDGAGEDEFRIWLGTGILYAPQAAGDLGRRLARAFQEARQAGAEQIIIIGSDCPFIDTTTMSRAFTMLQTHDLVLGPALDGGYYLIGLSRMVPGLFIGIDWGTAIVLQQTLQAAAALGLTTALLTPLPDIDRPEDLDLLRSAGGFAIFNVAE